MATAGRRVRVGAIELDMLEDGVGGRPLLVVHGFTGAKEDFADHLDAFAAAGWHTVVPDLRGHGTSDAPPSEAAYSLEVLAADIVGIADVLGWERFALLGHSMGGMAAQLVALAAPERLGALVLMGTSHGPVDVDRSLALASVDVVRDRGTAALIELLRAMGGSPLQTPAARQLREDRGWVAFGDHKLASSSPAMYAAMVPEMLDQADRLEDLAALEVPTLVVAGEQDATFLAACRRLASAIPGARLAVLADAGHSPQHESPEAWREAVLSFLEPVAR